MATSNPGGAEPPAPTPEGARAVGDAPDSLLGGEGGAINRLRPRLHLDVRTGRQVPLHEQLRAQLAVHIASGRLRPAQRLPTIRELAAEIGLAPGTVARAYRELESAGLVIGKGRGGTVVVDRPPNAEAVLELEARLTSTLEEVVAISNRLGIEPAKLEERLRSTAARRRNRGPDET